ncbi:MAG TPA: hypothetical protein VFR37_00630, partial [Longimicrobium sp.]|nr:hypothetical protein [Longimicrobium sp.]
MSRHIAMRCACGQMDFDASASFTAVVWDDVLGCLREWGIERPWYPSFGPLEVDGDELHGWWSSARAAMDAVDLPTLHQVWEEVTGTSGRPLQHSAAAYFVWRGRTYMTEAVWDRLTARPLP